MSRSLAALTAALFLCCAGNRPAPRPPLFPAAPLWKTLLGEFAVPPLAADSRRLYVATRDGAVRSLDPATGEVAWKSAGLPGRLSAINGVLLVRSEDGTLTSLQPRTGKPRWQARTAIAGTVPAVIDDDRALVAGRGGLAAVDLATGKVLWTRSEGGELTAPPVRAGARLLTGGRDGALRCLDRATGSPLWMFRTRRPLLVPPLVDIGRGRVYLGTTEKRIVEIELADGSAGWSWTVGADVAEPGLLLAERVLFAPMDAVLYVLHRGGNLAWRGALPSRPLSGPLLVSGYVVVACLENEIVSFDPDSGRLAGTLRTPTVIRSAPLAVGPVLAVALSDRSVVAYPLAGAAAAPPAPAAPPEPPAPAPTKVEPEAPGR